VACFKTLHWHFPQGAEKTLEESQDRRRHGRDSNRKSPECNLKASVPHILYSVSFDSFAYTSKTILCLTA
jgi:hypothetical protein